MKSISFLRVTLITIGVAIFLAYFVVWEFGHLFVDFQWLQFAGTIVSETRDPFSSNKIFEVQMMQGVPGTPQQVLYLRGLKDIEGNEITVGKRYTFDTTKNLIAGIYVIDKADVYYLDKPGANVNGGGWGPHCIDYCGPNDRHIPFDP